MKKLLLIVIGILYTTMAYAVPVTVEFDLSNVRKYDAITETSTYLPNTFGSVTFENTVTNTHHYPHIIYIDFGNFYDIKWNSSFTQLIELNPYGSNEFNDGRVYASICDDMQYFLEHSSIFSSIEDQSNDYNWKHSIRLKTAKLSLPKSGIGEDAYVHTSENMFDVRTNSLISNDYTYFLQRVVHYNYITG